MMPLKRGYFCTTATFRHMHTKTVFPVVFIALSIENSVLSFQIDQNKYSLGYIINCSAHLGVCFIIVIANNDVFDKDRSDRPKSVGKFVKTLLSS